MNLLIPEELEPYLFELAEMEVLGDNKEDVALHLVREGLARELRGGGLLRELLNAERLKPEIQINIPKGLPITGGKPDG